MKLSQEEKEDIEVFVASESFKLVGKALEVHYQREINRYVNIGSDEPNRLQLSKAKLEGMKSLLEFYNNF